MIDSGAGGADLLFHGRATREMGLVTEDEAAGRGDRSRVRTVRGVGGEGQNAMKVVLGDLQWADWGGVRFHKVRGRWGRGRVGAAPAPRLAFVVAFLWPAGALWVCAATLVHCVSAREPRSAASSQGVIHTQAPNTPNALTPLMTASHPPPPPRGPSSRSVRSSPSRAAWTYLSTRLASSAPTSSTAAAWWWTTPTSA